MLQEILFLVPETLSQNFWLMLSVVLVSFAVLFLVFVYVWVSFFRQKKIEKNIFEGLDVITSIEQKKYSKVKIPHNVFLKFFVESFLLLGFKESWQKFLLLLLIFASILGGLMFFVKKSLLLGVGVFVSVFVFGILLVFFKASDRKKKLVEQIPVFLQAMGNAMQAGYSLPASFSFIAEELDEPLKDEVLKINQKLQLQIPLNTVLKEFSDKLKNPEVDFFTESTIIQIQTGGNLVKLFNKIAYLLEEKLKLKRDIKSFTSQGKLSGILIAFLWPASLLIFSWLSPEHVSVLFETTLGKILLGISLSFELIGFFFIWKIISVKI